MDIYTPFALFQLSLVTDRPSGYDVLTAPLWGSALQTSCSQRKNDPEHVELRS